MKRFEMLEHTADICFRVRGANLLDLFQSSLSAMNSYLFGENFEYPNSQGTEMVSIESTDPESLLVDFLSDLLCRTISQSKAYLRFNKASITNLSLNCEVEFCECQASEEIKAVTYHGLKIENMPEFWQATIIFDI